MFISREERANLATKWYNKALAELYNDIKSCISLTIVETGYVLPCWCGKEPQFEHTEVVVENIAAEDACIKYVRDNPDSHGCILNFASYTHPGGGFIHGGATQEEALCHASALYPVLKSFQRVYEDRIKNKSLNNGLYNEDFIFSPCVPFCSTQYSTENTFDCSVLTYAAPNMMRKPKTEHYYQVLEERMRIAYVYPSIHGADTLLLGAWGCGVFCNNADFVAKTWDKLTREYDGLYKRVIHPVPCIGKGGPQNQDIFQKNISFGRI